MQESANIGTSQLRRLTGDFRARHLATLDAHERKFRDLLKQGIELGEFAPLSQTSASDSS